MCSCGKSKNNEAPDSQDAAAIVAEEVVSASEDNESEPSSALSVSNTESSVAESSNASSENWDSILDSYEQYVDKYVRLAKKAANGDMDAMTEYVSYLEEAQSLSEKLSSAEGEMSASQLSRYAKINAKMMNAVK